MAGSFFYKGGEVMINSFYMNGDRWLVRFVNPTNRILVDRTGTLTIGVSDYGTRTVYLANNLYGEKLNRVFVHELGHCALFSYGLLPHLHKMVKKQYWIEAEEWACNFLSDYGGIIFCIAQDIMGDRFVWVEPYGAERLVA